MKISRMLANDHHPKLTTEQIAVAAFHLYVENGCRDGYDLDDWLRAEKLLMQSVSVAQVQVFERSRKAANNASEIRQNEAHA